MTAPHRHYAFHSPQTILFEIRGIWLPTGKCTGHVPQKAPRDRQGCVCRPGGYAPAWALLSLGYVSSWRFPVVRSLGAERLLRETRAFLYVVGKDRF
jgi:hypothetical protein